MALFKRKDDDWNIWDEDDFEETNTFIEPKSLPNKHQPKSKVIKKKEKEEFNVKENESNLNIQEKPKKISRKEKKRQELIQKRIDESVENFDNADNLVNNHDNVINLAKVFGFLVVLFVCGLGVIGYINTDFDDNNKGYVVSYDLHYERDYVKVSDEVLEECIDFYENLPRIMQSMESNTLTTTTELNTYFEVLEVKTLKLKKYTKKPDSMKAYDETLLNHANSTASLINNIKENYQKEFYLAWAEEEFNKYETNINNLKILRGEINNMIYRNVYDN